MARNPILIIDDEPDLVELVSYHLDQEGFPVIAERDGRLGLEAARRHLPRLIILDLMLPGMDGLQVCRSLRSDRETGRIPLIMLTAKGSETDRVVGLELGADDYVTKPFSPRELVARVRAVLRRQAAAEEPPEVVRHGALCVDTIRYQVSYDGAQIRLTTAEFAILKFLARHPEQVFSRSQIIEGALGRDVIVTDRNIDVHIGAVRKKLGRGKAHIDTVRGVGYRFVPSIDPADVST